MTNQEGRIRRPGTTLVLAALVVIACLRLLTIVHSGLSATHGDFAVTLPGEYAERLNPTLWSSPDLAVPFYDRHWYAYGPTQYLTLFPIVFLDSYRQIAFVLLLVYTAIVLTLPYLLWRLCRACVPTCRENRVAQIALIAAIVFMFSPLLHALVQREFEVVQLLLLVAAVHLLVGNRDVAAAGVIGYAALFKYWPFFLGSYLVLKRRWFALSVLWATVGAVLLVAHRVFDLAYFKIADVSQLSGYRERLFGGFLDDQPFCTGPNGTFASLRSGLCTIEALLPGFSAEAGFYFIILLAGALFLGTFVVLERSDLPESPADAKWRVVLEFSLIMMGISVTIRAHYYYLCVLLIPITALAYRYFCNPGSKSPIRQTLLVGTYVLLSAFIVPISILSRMLGQDVWTLYMGHGVYVYGLGLLAGLLLWEYAELATGGWVLKWSLDPSVRTPGLLRR